ncbi:MAG: hypothetical protein ACFFAO_09825 [Candidatus Hermodarchaeota archaeon]
MLLKSFNEYLLYKFQFMWLFIVIPFMFLICVLWILNLKYSPTEKAKKLYLGYFAFIFCYTLTRIFFFIADFYGEYGGMEDSFEFILYIKLAYISTSVGLVIFFFFFERDFVPTKFIFTGIAFIFGVLFIFLPYDYMKLLMYIMQPIYLLEIMSIYIYLLIKGTGDLKKKALSSIISLIIFFVGILLDTRAVTDLNIIPAFIAPIVFMIGLGSFYYTQKFEKTEQ